VAYTLLLADDSITMQRVIELTFSDKDVHVVSVSDGEEAIARIPVVRPDIVLADIGMPRRDGYEVAAFVRSQPDLAHIPVLLLAGAFEPIDESRARALRCDGVLVKPFEPQHVVARVRGLLEGGVTTAPAPVSSLRPVDVAAGHPPHGDVLPVSDDDGPSAATAAPVDELADSGSTDASGAGVNGATPVASDDPANTVAPPPDGALDDYIEKLNAGFGAASAERGLEEAPTRPDDPVSRDAERAIPTASDPLRGARQGGVEEHGSSLEGAVEETYGDPPEVPTEPDGTAAVLPEDPSGDLAPIVSAARSIQDADGSTRGPIAEALTVLLTVEPPEVPDGWRPVHADPLLTDQLVDEVTRRVLERVAPAAAREVVTQIVSEVAERLVREEIARIRGQHPSNPG
jgi:CheY-like chemotaxis protein